MDIPSVYVSIMLNQNPNWTTASEKLGAPFGTDLFRGSPTGPARWNSTRLQDFASTVWFTLWYWLKNVIETNKIYTVKVWQTDF